MLREIRLTNFRKFEKFTVSLKEGNVLVGPNNAGKSAIVEALRILESCIRLTRKRTPETVLMPDGNYLFGHRIPDSSIEVDLSHSSHNYIDAPTILEFKIELGSKATIVIERDKQIVFAVEPVAGKLTTAAKFTKAFPLKLGIVPTLATLERDEQYVQDDTIRKSQWRKQSSRHFRNVWYRKSDDEFSAFAEDVEAAWPGITIQKPDRQSGNPQYLDMFYSENRLDREVKWAGFGFQIWLQILTHLNRLNDDGVVVIDEPDIYLHPDLQKKLIRRLREKYSQFIMATHSVELINEAEEMEVVSINPKYKNARRIKSEDDYNGIRTYLGSSMNVDFARLAKARKVVFVEGEDRKLLQIFAKKFELHNLSANVVPFVKLGGFQGWERAKGAVWAFKEILDIDIEVFCLFDRDYRCDENILAFEAEMKLAGLECRVLSRKEIENYLLDLPVLTSAISSRAAERGINLNMNDIEGIIFDISEKMKSHIIGQRTARAYEYFKSIGDKRDVGTIASITHDDVEIKWKKLSERLRIVPGKDFLSDLNTKLQTMKIGSLTHRMIAEHIKIGQFAPNFTSLLRDLDKFCSVE